MEKHKGGKLPAQRAGLLKNLKNYCFRLLRAAIHPPAKQGAFSWQV